jgi:hypothetical protein
LWCCWRRRVVVSSSSAARRRPEAITISAIGTPAITPKRTPTAIPNASALNWPAMRHAATPTKMNAANKTYGFMVKILSKARSHSSV